MARCPLWGLGPTDASRRAQGAGTLPQDRLGVGPEAWPACGPWAPKAWHGCGEGKGVKGSMQLGARAWRRGAKRGSTGAASARPGQALPLFQPEVKVLPTWQGVMWRPAPRQDRGLCPAPHCLPVASGPWRPGGVESLWCLLAVIPLVENTRDAPDMQEEARTHGQTEGQHPRLR